MDALLTSAPQRSNTTRRRQSARRPRKSLELKSRAVLFEGAGRLTLTDLDLVEPGVNDLVVDVEWSGVSTGTERLLWSGDMPAFPGMSYPLVPGYEAVGRVVWADARTDLLGARVFAPGARCFHGASGLFGASASRLIVDAARVAPLPEDIEESGALLALAATAYHAIAGGAAPDLVVGHGVLGRLLVRVSMALGHAPPVVWEVEPERAFADGYAVIDADCDGRADYRAVYDVSGDTGVLDELISRLARGGEVTLAGFYSDRPSFAFPPAFMREARLRVAAEWTRDDLDAVIALAADGALPLDDLVTHSRPAADAAAAYRTAFEDPACLKMILDWSDAHDHAH